MTGYKQGVNTDGEVIRDFYVEHDPVDLDCQAAGDGMTRQEFKDECDINVLMATYERGGALNHFNRVVPEYLDVSEVPDLQQSISFLQRAETAFMTLPAIVRREFDQDPLKFIDYASNPSNIDRMREWGLAPPKSASEPVPPAPAPSGDKPA